jgi:prolyl-tRNA synthetase
MRLSTLFGRTLREAPADAEHLAYQLVLRAGLVRQLQAGSYALMPLGMRVARRIEAIMHQELARIDAQELRTPVVQAAALWEQSGRYVEYGPLMLRFADRSGRPFIVAPTNEEAIAALASREISSYRQMPALIYQVYVKYRDELRTKGGLMRMREFTMLDAYSLDADQAGLDRSYERIAVAFERIFTRCGVRFVAVEASAGEMGGREPREYMALSPAGEDTLVLCAHCGYAANLEVAVSRATNDQRPPTTDDEGDKETGRQGDKETPDTRHPTPDTRTTEVATPECPTIADLAAFLGIPQSATAKAVFFDTPERGLVFAVIRGDLEINEAKLCAAAGVSELAPARVEQIAAAGAVAGYASPIGLKILADDRRPTTDDRRQGDKETRRQGDKETTNLELNTQHSTLKTSSPSSILHPPSSGIYVIADRSVVAAGPLVAGANRDGYHLRNVVYGRDWRATTVADIAAVRAGDPCLRCGAALRFERGIELGHIFKLGTRFSEALGAAYLDQGGVARTVVMGSYGIGVERLLQVIVEQHCDAAGIAWPAAVAPADLQLVRLGKTDAIRAAGDELYEELRAAGVRVLYDDRDESPGVQFNDADLIGLPLRLLISARLLSEGAVEVKPRGGEALKVARAAVLDTVLSAINS